jgi:hypothetical protein
MHSGHITPIKTGVVIIDVSTSAISVERSTGEIGVLQPIKVVITLPFSSTYSRKNVVILLGGTLAMKLDPLNR